ncbi:MAG: hypothetical protein KC609_20960 [Myxococcales bacterium]|nr:hypothetical protein [Myxococcales bacterium]
MNRREFVIRIGQVLLATPVLFNLESCKSSSEPGFTVMNQDDAGHTHTFKFVCSALTANGATFTATGSGHSHEVTVTKAEIDQIAAGQQVLVMTTSFHDHTWVFQMPAEACV